MTRSQCVQEEETKNAEQRFRGSESAAVRLQVGQIVQHCKYGYRGVITGWDTACLVHTRCCGAVVERAAVDVK